MPVTASWNKTVGGTVANAAACPDLAFFLRPTLPDEDQLVGMYLFGGSEALSLRNLYNPAAPLLKVGSPTINALGAQTSLGNCFDTGIAETAAMTMLAVFKPTGGTTGFLMGTFQNGASPVGIGLYSQAANISATPPVSNAAITPVTTDWYQAMARFTSTSSKVGYRRNDTLSAQGSTSGAARTLSSRTVRIGAEYGTGFGGAQNILFAALWTKELSDANRDATFAALDSFFTNNAGIATL